MLRKSWRPAGARDEAENLPHRLSRRQVAPGRDVRRFSSLCDLCGRPSGRPGIPGRGRGEAGGASHRRPGAGRTADSGGDCGLGGDTWDLTARSRPDRGWRRRLPRGGLLRPGTRCLRSGRSPDAGSEPGVGSARGWRRRRQLPLCMGLGVLPGYSVLTTASSLVWGSGPPCCTDLRSHSPGVRVTMNSK